MTSQRRALAFVMGLFFLCGLSTAMNSILIPYFHDALQLPYAAVVCLETSFYLGYFLWSPLAGKLFPSYRYVHGIRWGLVAATTGAALLSLCGWKLNFSLVLLAIFILGGGIATIQVTANPYAMDLGCSSSSSSRLCAAQALTSVGTLLAPLLGAYTILREADHIGPARSAALFIPYAIVTTLWALNLLIAGVSRLPTVSTKTVEESSPISARRDPVLALGLIAMALFLGAEAAVISFLVPYLSDQKILGISLEAGVKLSFFFWLGVLVGRLLGSLFTRHICAERLITCHLVIVTILCTFASCAGGYSAAVAVLSLGLSLSILFPFLFSIIVNRCRCAKNVASGILCTTNIGGALVPLGQGLLADRIGVPQSFIFPAICYLSSLVFFSMMCRAHQRKLAYVTL